ncbi:Hypothetical protein CAP_6982 [Chondromyces apiculatus DSM 436]|uniref:Uncharacterized protein n=1 Tax=Chondromyces apiculatus DSM 436 TaxID=1192034 RepID=A0A017TGL7_9BACT|nr:Hypothetical protein CAP_6982 [Chondromyces apiculatus DSM 436]
MKGATTPTRAVLPGPLLPTTGATLPTARTGGLRHALRALFT